jgi:hypothetical protein
MLSKLTDYDLIKCLYIVYVLQEQKCLISKYAPFFIKIKVECAFQNIKCQFVCHISFPA